MFNIIKFFREKRLDKERELLTEQINLLTNDVTKYNKDLVNIKREHTSQVISLQTHLQERNEEVNKFFNKNMIL